MRRIDSPILSWVLILAWALSFLFGAGLFAQEQFAQAPQNQSSQNQTGVKPVAKVSQVTVTDVGNGIEVEITTTRPVALRTQLVTGPDRLVLDFPDSLPGRDLRDQVINRGQLKGVRAGIFSQRPPVTRVVIDLKSAQPYRIYPSGKTVIVKVLTGEETAARKAPAHVDEVAYTPAPAKPVPTLNIDFKNGRLSIWADKASLAQVLNEVHQKTGAEVTFPPAAGQEQMVANIGLLPVREALTALLNGSRFNFILVGADNDPSKIKSVTLTFRSGGVSQPALAAPSEQSAVVEGAPQPDTAQPDMPAPPEAQPQPQEVPGPQEPSPPADTPPQ
jgi:hypothetical protein